MFTTTLNRIRCHDPCTSGWTTLLKGLGKTGPDDEPLGLTTILATNGLDDAIWCLRTLEGADREIRLFAVACARQVQHLMTDPRSLAALDVAERFANGQATREELAAARAAAYAAWVEADAARVEADAARVEADAARVEADAARAAVDAARAAVDAARAAVDAARAAVDAARAAVDAAWAVADAAWAVADAAWAVADAARASQEQLFRDLFG